VEVVPFNQTGCYRYIDIECGMCLAAFEMGRVSAFSLEGRIVLGKKKADSVFFLTS